MSPYLSRRSSSSSDIRRPIRVKRPLLFTWQQQGHDVENIQKKRKSKHIVDQCHATLCKSLKELKTDYCMQIKDIYI